jgi:ABC-2 type transport system permease protein
VALASQFNSVTVFPVISNAVLLPMFFLSGSLYKLTTAPHWMQVAAHFDPVAYGVDLMRYAVTGKNFFPLPLSLVALTVVIAALAGVAVRIFKRGEDDSGLGATKFSWARR